MSRTQAGTISVDRIMEVDPGVAWDLLVDTTRWAEWGPSVTEVSLPDHPDGRLRAHSRGRVRTPLGLWIPFTVTHFEDGRTWAWNVAGVPATAHVVEPVPQGCRVGFEVPVLAAPYALVCREALCRIERLTQVS